MTDRRLAVVVLHIMLRVAHTLNLLLVAAKHSHAHVMRRPSTAQHATPQALSTHMYTAASAV